MAEENEKRLQRDLEGTNKRLEERCATYEKLVKKETCMQEELDLSGKQDHLQQIIIDLEKNKEKFDQRLSEERSGALLLVMQRSVIEQKLKPR